MLVTRKIVADQLAAHLHSALPLTDLVDWAEGAVMDGEVELGQETLLMSVVARIGVADVRAYGLAWEDCVSLLRQLGYEPSVSVQAAS